MKEDLQSTNLNISVSKANSDITFDYEKSIKREYDKLTRIMEAYQSGIDTLDEYKQNKARITEEIENLKAEQQKELEKVPHGTVDDLKDKMKNAIELLSSPDSSESEKNKALKAFVDKIVFDRKKSKITIFYFL